MSATRRALFAIVRGAVNWRTGATVLASIIVALVLVVVVTGAQTTQAALHARAQTSAAATRRIDLLNQEIIDLAAQATRNGEVIGTLVDEVAALQEQVRQLGGKPVVTFTPTPSTTRPASRSTTSTTSTTRPAPTTTTTTAPCRVNVAGRCIGGRP